MGGLTKSKCTVISIRDYHVDFVGRAIHLLKCRDSSDRHRFHPDDTSPCRLPNRSDDVVIGEKTRWTHRRESLGQVSVKELFFSLASR
jgi:hypothetical protein